MTQDNMNVEQKTNWLDNQLGNLPELMCYRKHKKIQVIIIIYDDVCVRVRACENTQICHK